MTILDNVNTLIATQKSELEGLFTSLITKACPNGSCGKVCPNCGKVHPEDQGGGQPRATGGNDVSQTPDNQAQSQIVTASSMVQSMGIALKHPVQVNHDAEGVGVTHSVMTVHPEWNHDSVKSKIDSHLKSQGWKSGKSASGGGKTYAHSDGHQIHVAHVGKHLIVSGEDKKGSVPTPYNATKKPVKKSGSTLEDLVIDTFEEGIATVISSVSTNCVKNGVFP